MSDSTQRWLADLRQARESFEPNWKVLVFRAEKLLSGASDEIGRLKDDRTEALEQSMVARAAAEAHRDLSTCYRLGKAPSEKLFARLEKAREVLGG